jgi:hypothetical protein
MPISRARSHNELTLDAWSHFKATICLILLLSSNFWKALRRMDIPSLPMVKGTAQLDDTVQ